MRRGPLLLGLSQALLAAGCLGAGGPAKDGGASAESDAGVDAGVLASASPVFDADFEQTYREMRDCRHSHEHELHWIRVLASPSAQASYAALSPEVPYPQGATLVKVEYDDEYCSQLVLYTAYKKLARGDNPAGNDWLWQRIDPERKVLEQGAPWRCVQCHTYHCAPPNGYDLTCAEEL